MFPYRTDVLGHLDDVFLDTVQSKIPPVGHPDGKIR